jgi:GDP-L-fucose synthase
VTIKELALIIKGIVGYGGELVFNDDYPDGMPRKLLDVSRLNKMGWKSKIKLDEGLQSAYDWYVNNVA